MDTHLGDQFDQLVGTFSYDPSLLAFAQLFCDQSYNDSSSNEFEVFCLLALFECVNLDRPALLQTYLSMYTTVEVFVDIATKRGSSAIIGSFHSLSLSTLKVALAYTEALGQGSESPCQGQSLVQQTFISALAKRIDEILGHLHVPNVDMQGPENVLISYFNYQWPPESNLDKSQSGEMLESDLIQRFIFSSYLLWHDIPKPSLVNAAVQSVCQVFPEFRKSGVDATMTLPLLAMLLPGTPTSTLIQINNCLPYLVTGS